MPEVKDSELTPERVRELRDTLTAKPLRAWVVVGGGNDHLSRGIALNSLEIEQVLALAHAYLELAAERDRLRAGVEKARELRDKLKKSGSEWWDGDDRCFLMAQGVDEALKGFE